MKAGAIYGLFLGVANVVFTQVLPQPWGSVTLWTLVAVHLTWGARLTWRRTGWPIMTLAMSIGAVGMALLAGLAVTGHVYPDIPRIWWAPFGLLAILCPVCLWVESRIHREQWAQWRGQMQGLSAWDILLGRHIPVLRAGNECGA